MYLFAKQIRCVKTADFLFLPFTANFRLFRHFERSEKSIDRSFAALRMTAAV
ncbi:MAG: hypothetical protein IJ566_07230 [Cardiobacteriaceae bacterium]|nr:hypothetical protein [Cardiobacteriaceae bacterium]